MPQEGAPPIVIVDYGMGNLRSVQRGFGAVGVAAELSGDPAVVATAERLVVPGVGAFGDAMRELASRRLVEPIRAHARAGKPYLGICLGLQLLFEVSEEHGEHEGLGLLAGRVVSLPADVGKVPHLGWNRALRKGEHPVLRAVEDGTFFYFVHSFVAVPSDPEVVAAETDYGGRFVSAVASGSIFACQFHPEKSQAAGLALLEAFAKWSP